MRRLPAVRWDAEQELYRLQAEFCKGIAHPKRIYILSLLKDGEKSVGQLAQTSKIPQANLSQHLALMRQLGLVRTRRDGPSVFYRVADGKIVEACELVRGAINERLRGSKETLETLS